MERRDEGALIAAFARYFSVPKMLPHRLQHQRVTSSLSLILSTRRSPQRVHGGAVGCASSVVDIAQAMAAIYRPDCAQQGEPEGDLDRQFEQSMGLVTLFGALLTAAPAAAAGKAEEGTVKGKRQGRVEGTARR